MRWVRLLQSTLRAALTDDILDWSAALSFYFMFALFPGILLVAALLSTLKLQRLTDNFVAMLDRRLPAQVAALVSEQLNGLLQHHVPGLISLGLIVLLYAASQGFIGLMSALNAAYEVPETRPYWRRMALAFGLTFSAGIFVALALGLLVAGRQILELIAGPANLGSTLDLIWPWIRWIGAGILMIVAVRMLYRFAPNTQRNPSGAFAAVTIALLAWLAASAGFAYYVDNFGRYSALYGSLAAVIALMLWFYIFALSILFGAELHNEWLKQQNIKVDVYIPPQNKQQANQRNKHVA